MTEKILIWRCEFPMKRGILDNDYAFYSDGTIIHEYDRAQNDLNREDEVKGDDMGIELKTKILGKCPDEHLDFIKKTLGFITKQDLIDLGWTENTKDGNFEKNFSGMDFKLIPNGYGFIPQGNNRHFVQIDSIKDLKDFMDTL